MKVWKMRCIPAPDTAAGESLRVTLFLMRDRLREMDVEAIADIANPLAASVVGINVAQEGDKKSG